MARRGWAGQGEAWIQQRLSQGMAWPGWARRGLARQGEARHGYNKDFLTAWQGEAGRGKARLGEARLGKGIFRIVRFMDRLGNTRRNDMLKQKTFQVKGIAPLIMHNGQLANPMNEWTQRLKKLSGKRNKTEETYEQMAEVEWYGSLLLNGKGHPCIPSEYVEACLVSGAKKSKLGKAFKASIFCDGDAALKYSGPKGIDALWADKSFVDQRLVKVGMARIVRTRPIFHEWSAEFAIQFDNTVIELEQLETAIEAAGMYEGVCDFRPKFGRFLVV